MADNKQRDMEREADILAKRKEGWTLQEIGEQHGITRERVRQILKRNGVVWREQMSGYVGASTAAKMRNTDYGHFRKMKNAIRSGRYVYVPVRQVSEFKTPRQKTQELHATILFMYRSGKTLREISDAAGRSVGSVSRILAAARKSDRAFPYRRRR